MTQLRQLDSYVGNFVLWLFNRTWMSLVMHLEPTQESRISRHPWGILQISPQFPPRQRLSQSRVHNRPLCSNPNNGSCPWYKTNIISYLPTLTVCQASILSGLCCVNSSNLPSNPRRELKYIPTLQMRSLRFKEPVLRPHVLSHHAVLTLVSKWSLQQM